MIKGWSSPPVELHIGPGPGDQTAKITIPRAYLCRTSFFEKALKEHWKEGHESRVQRPEDHVDAMGIFTVWLLQGLSLDMVCAGGTSAFVRLYYTADKWVMPELKAQICALLWDHVQQCIRKDNWAPLAECYNEAVALGHNDAFRYIFVHIAVDNIHRHHFPTAIAGMVVETWAHDMTAWWPIYIKGVHKLDFEGETTGEAANPAIANLVGLLCSGNLKPSVLIPRDGPSFPGGCPKDDEGGKAWLKKYLNVDV